MSLYAHIVISSSCGLTTISESGPNMLDMVFDECERLDRKHDIYGVMVTCHETAWFLSGKDLVKLWYGDNA